MRALGPAWWGGLVLGLSLGVFFTALVAESDVLPATAGGWKVVRVAALVVAVLTAVVGGWRYRRGQADSSSDG